MPNKYNSKFIKDSIDERNRLVKLATPFNNREPLWKVRLSFVHHSQFNTLSLINSERRFVAKDFKAAHAKATKLVKKIIATGVVQDAKIESIHSEFEYITD